MKLKCVFGLCFPAAASPRPRPLLLLLPKHAVHSLLQLLHEAVFSGAAGTKMEQNLPFDVWFLSACE